jgi:hypothetical protein
MERRNACRCTVTATVVVTSALLVAGCTPASHRAAADSQTSPAAHTAAAVTRWWSNGVAAARSTIDPGDPTGAASKLTPSRAQYCGMLHDTLAAGRSVLPGVAAGDPVLTTATEAFTAELTHVAPPQVTAQWALIGTAVLQLVRSPTTTPTAARIDAAKVRQAVTDVAADAKASCHLDLSVSRK